MYVRTYVPTVHICTDSQYQCSTAKRIPTVVLPVRMYRQYGYHRLYPYNTVPVPDQAAQVTELLACVQLRKYFLMPHGTCFLLLLDYCVKSVLYKT